MEIREALPTPGELLEIWQRLIAVKDDNDRHQAKRFEKYLEELSVTVRQSWTAAMFSEASEHTLQRYFKRQLQQFAELGSVVAEIANTPPLVNESKQKGNVHALFNGLLVYLLRNYPTYVDLNIEAPAFYAQYLCHSWGNDLLLLNDNLAKADINPQLATLLKRYLGHFKKTTTIHHWSYRHLNYTGEFISTLLKLDPTSTSLQSDLEGRLLEMNFNDLGLFHYFVQGYKLRIALTSPLEQLRFYRLEHARIRCYLSRPDLAYDSQWPPLKEMLLNWLSEEIQVLEKETQGLSGEQVLSQLPKIPLNFSAAYLACLLKLFHENDHFSNISLTEIFKLTSQYYRTKRQSKLSANSLSKEYYTINQMTASRVREILLRMVATLNRLYFP